MQSISLDTLHAMNARHDRDYADAGQQEPLDALRCHGDGLARVVRGLSNEQLGRTTLVFGGREMSVQQIAERVIIGQQQLSWPLSPSGGAETQELCRLPGPSVSVCWPHGAPSTT